MPVCLLHEDCKCLEHQLLDCIREKLNEEAESLLQELGNICEAIDNSGWTLLHHSVNYGNAEMTRYLIDEGCDVNAQENSGFTPLMLAVRSAKNPTVVEILLENNADMYMTDFAGRNSLHIAFYAPFELLLHPERTCIFQMLFDKVNRDFSEGDLRKFSPNANNALKLAIVIYANAKTTRFVLENGYPIDYRVPEDGMTALHLAISRARLENAKILIQHGADVDALDKVGRSPLAYYVDLLRHFEDTDDNRQVLQGLLGSTSSLSVPDRAGYSCVERLLMSGNKRTARTVLRSGIDVGACLINGKSLFYLLVVENANEDVGDLLTELAIRFDPNERITPDGKTALMKAVSEPRSWKKVDFLLREGADVNVTTPSGISTLHSVYSDSLTRGDLDNEHDKAKVLELLLQYGVDDRPFLNEILLFIDDLSVTTGLIVAHFAMLVTAGEISSIDASLSVTRSNPAFEAYFELCLLQLNETKAFKLHGAVTLFDFMTARLENLVSYSRNRVLLASLNKSIEDSIDFEYYVNIMRRRVATGQGMAILQEKAALVIEALTGLCADVYRLVAFKIIGYLDRQDLRILCQIVSR